MQISRIKLILTVLTVYWIFAFSGEYDCLWKTKISDSVTASILFTYRKLAALHIPTVFITFCLPNSSIMIGYQNSVLLNYSFSLVCVANWPWALVSQVAATLFSKPSVNDYGKSCLQQFLLLLAFFSPTCLCFSFLSLFLFFSDFQFLFLPYTLQPSRLS